MAYKRTIKRVKKRVKKALKDPKVRAKIRSTAIRLASKPKVRKGLRQARNFLDELDPVSNTNPRMPTYKPKKIKFR